jgi:hypothetical protein
MTGRIPLNEQDRRLLTRLDDDVIIDASGETAVITDCKIKITRTAANQLEMEIEFANVKLPILMPRAETMLRFNIRTDD